MKKNQIRFINRPSPMLRMLTLVLTVLLSQINYGQQTFGDPVDGNAQISCPFQSQCAHSNPSFQHTALDYGSNNGLNIKATADGKVSKVETMNSNDHGMGSYIIVQHRMSNGGIKYSSYSHLASIASGISVGTVVNKGQTIGTMGGSGYGNPNHWGVHLHFEVKNGNVSHNPSGNGTYWGYTPGNPLNWGYWNPTSYLGVQTVIPQPDITSPLHNANNVPVNLILNWNNVSGATNYRVQVKKGSSSGFSAENGFYSGNGTTNSVVVNQTTGNSSQASITLEPNTTYFWTVRVANSSTNSYYSQVKSFTTGSSGGSNTSCNNFSSVTATPSNTSATLTINGVSSGAESYAYRYKESGTNTWNGWYWGSQTINISNLSSGTQYIYQVAVFCSSQGWNISSELNFTTTGSSGGSNTLCNNFSSVTATPSNTSVTLTINGVSSGAESYAYRYKESGTNTWNGWYWGNQTININNLSSGTQYVYQVAVFCSSQGWNISSELNFTTTGSNGGGSGNSGATGCNGGSQYPTNTLYPSNTWQYANCLYAGEYAKFYVTNGQTYSFSTCSEHGASASYDTELTLKNNNGTTLSFNDDFCGLQSKITWTSSFTGYIRVLVTEYHCSTNTSCTNLAYKKGSANFSENNDSTNSLTINEGNSIYQHHLVKEKKISNQELNNKEVYNSDLFLNQSGNINFEVYPNPVSNDLNLVLGLHDLDGEILPIVIYNSHGIIVKTLQKEVNVNHFDEKIDVSDIPNGCYIISILNGKQISSKRFIIVK